MVFGLLATDPVPCVTASEPEPRYDAPAQLKSVVTWPCDRRMTFRPPVSNCPSPALITLMKFWFVTPNFVSHLVFPHALRSLTSRNDALPSERPRSPPPAPRVCVSQGH